MNYSTAIFLISNEVRAILVSYETVPEGRTPETTMYKTLNQDIKVGDYVVIPTDSRHHMTVCKVEKIDVEPDLDSDNTMEWIIGVVDSVDSEDVKRQEQAAIEAIKSAEKRRKRNELRDALLADTGDEVKALPIFTQGEE